MRKTIIIIISIFLLSCNPFDENRVLEHKNELQDLVKNLEKYENGTYDSHAIDEFIKTNIRDLDIDLLVKNSGEKIQSTRDLLKRAIV